MMTISPRHSGVDSWGQRQPPVETDGAASIPFEDSVLGEWLRLALMAALLFTVSVGLLWALA